MRKSLQRAVALALTAAMMMGLCMTSSAAQSVTITLDGQVIETAAYVDGNNRTQAPAAISEALGMTVTADGAAAAYTKDGVSVTFEGSQAGKITMDTTAVEGYVPIAYLASAFGYGIQWDGAARVAALTSPDSFEAIDLAYVTAPARDYSESNQLPMTGYFKSGLTGDYAGREVRWYIPEAAILRPYFHFIAVPGGVDVDQFLLDSGWKQIADETGECLYVMVPDQATGVWGDTAAEKGYITAAKNFHGTMGSYFTTFGEFYLIGYGEGAAPLEAWAAENPHFVISQAYIDGDSEGAAALKAAGDGFYGYDHITDGDNKDRDGDGVNERKDANGNWKILYQMTDRLKTVVNPDAGENAGLLKKSDMPVPTWLINDKSSENLAYWQQVNRTKDSGASVSALGGIAVSGQVYVQDGDTWATEYAGHISKVTDLDTSADTVAYAFSRALRDEMTDYTRYDNSISYGNGLFYRLDYTSIQRERFTSAGKEAKGTVSGPGLDGKQVKGEITIKALTLPDGYVSDLLVYVPESAPAKDIPVVLVYHGGSQNGHLFMDSTVWWQTAAAEGFALALPTRTDFVTGTTDAYDVDIFDAVTDYLAADGRFDMGRVYATGQSMGSVASITVAEERAAELAAVISSNAGNPSRTSGGDFIPVGIVVGEGNYADRGIPGYVADTNYPEDATDTLVRSTAAAAAGADIYWDAAYTSKGDPSHNMNTWIDYFADANGVTNDDLRDTIVYSGASSLNKGTNTIGTLADWNTNNARYRTWYWDNEDGIPVMTYVMAMYQAHNCQPGYRPLMWDFMKHYSVETAADGTVTHYYSESGFAKDDRVILDQSK